MKRAVAVTVILLMVFLIQPIAHVGFVEANLFIFGPEWQIYLPEQWNSKTYQTSTVPIEVQIYTPSDYPKITKVYYILDLNFSSNNNPQKSLLISSPQSITYYGEQSTSYLATGTLKNLSNGTHTIDVWAINAQGETSKSGTRNFLVNTTSTYPTGNSEHSNNLEIVIVIAIIAAIGIATSVVLSIRKMKKKFSIARPIQETLT